jgi:protease IV
VSGGRAACVAGALSTGARAPERLPSPGRMVFYLLVALVRNLLRLLTVPTRLWARARACPPGAWVQLSIDGSIIELRRPRSRLPWARQQHPGLALDRLRELVDAMLADPSPAGLLVTIKRLHAPAAFRTAVYGELRRLRDAGRKVVIHLPGGGSSPELLLASAGSRVLLGAQTTLGPLGFHLSSLYFRDALDKAGLVPDVLAEGAFKTAGESLARNSMSEPQKEQLGRLLDVLYDEQLDALCQGRGVDREKAIAWLDRGLIDAEQAVSDGLADAAIHDDELLHLLEPSRSLGPARTIGAGSYLRRRARPLFVPLRRAPIIAVIEAHGPIVEHAPGRFGSFCDAEKLVDLVAQAEKNPNVVGVVLHIDSPGGGVLASEKIHRAVSRLASAKPVVSCFGGVSASGGYYIAAATHAIVARPTTITGSIGVVAARVLPGPLLERLGVKPEVLRRGAHADMMSMTRPFDEQERRLFEAELERAYKHFVALVARGRSKRPEDILPLAGGRVWTGRDALERGLVDRLGGLSEAAAEVRARAGEHARGARPTLFSHPPRFEPPSLLQLVPGLSETASLLQLLVGATSAAGLLAPAFSAATPLDPALPQPPSAPRERILAMLPLWSIP